MYLSYFLLFFLQKIIVKNDLLFSCGTWIFMYNLVHKRFNFSGNVIIITNRYLLHDFTASRHYYVEKFHHFIIIFLNQLSSVANRTSFPFPFRTNLRATNLTKISV